MSNSASHATTLSFRSGFPLSHEQQDCYVLKRSPRALEAQFYQTFVTLCMLLKFLAKSPFPEDKLRILTFPGVVLERGPFGSLWKSAVLVTFDTMHLNIRVQFQRLNKATTMDTSRPCLFSANTYYTYNFGRVWSLKISQ